MGVSASPVVSLFLSMHLCLLRNTGLQFCNVQSFPDSRSSLSKTNHKCIVVSVSKCTVMFYAVPRRRRPS